MKAYELTGTEATEISYLEPRRATWKNWAEAVIGTALIAFFTYALLLLAASSLR